MRGARGRVTQGVSGSAYVVVCCRKHKGNQFFQIDAARKPSVSGCKHRWLSRVCGLDRVKDKVQRAWEASGVRCF